MKGFKKYLILAGVLVGLAIAGTMMNPHSASGTPGPSLVQIVPSVPFGDTASGSSGLPPTITVPTGQRLIIETLSVQVDVTPSGSQIEAFVNYTSAGKSVTLFVPLTFSNTRGPAGDTFDTYVATLAVRLYPDPSTSVTLTVSSPTGSTGTDFLTLSGYLI